MILSPFSTQVVQYSGKEYNFEHRLLKAGLLVVERLNYPTGKNKKKRLISIQNCTGTAPY